MAVDMFLKLDGIDGESVDDKHKGEIELLSFSWGANQTANQGFGGGFGANKVSVQDFSFLHKLDKASPQLMTHACSGAHIKHALLSVRTRGEQGRDAGDYLTIKFSDILISSYQSGGNSQAGEIPMEQVSLNFSKFEMEYKPQDPNGKLGEPVSSACGAEVGKSPRRLFPSDRQ